MSSSRDQDSFDGCVRFSHAVVLAIALVASVAAAVIAFRLMQGHHWVLTTITVGGAFVVCFVTVLAVLVIGPLLNG